jgi:energy-coupling factor transporter ATP-binding protein EcfA2
LETIDIDFTQGPASEGQWALILGDNGTGKSTILGALALACIGEGAARSMLSLAGAPFLRDGDDEGSIRLELTTGESLVKLRHGHSAEEIVQQTGTQPIPVFAYGCQRGTALGDPEIEYRPDDNVRTLFGSHARLWHAESWLLRRRVAALRKNGHASEFFDVVCQTLIDVMPGVETMDVSEDGVVFTGPKIGRAPLAGMSDGYSTTVGWLVDLIARWSERSRLAGEELEGDFRQRMTGLVLIDEIDLHLHPQWQLEIVATLREQFPRLSFVATTHNPLTLLGARPGEIHVLRRSADGRIGIWQKDAQPGLSADQILTGEWFGLSSTDHPRQVSS